MFCLQNLTIVKVLVGKCAANFNYRTLLVSALCYQQFTIGLGGVMSISGGAGREDPDADFKSKNRVYSKKHKNMNQGRGRARSPKYLNCE